MSNVILETQLELLKRLKDLVGDSVIAKEGISFKPLDGVYYRTQFRISPPDDPVLGTGYYRERIEFQVFVHAPANQGTAAAINAASEIRTIFKKGSTFTRNGFLIHVLETPHIAGTTTFGDRTICPVMIPVVTEVLC